MAGRCDRLIGDRPAVADLGARLGEAIARRTALAHMAVREQSLHVTSRVAGKVIDDFFELVGGEIRRTVAPLWLPLAESSDAPQWLRDTARFAHRGKGQWATMLSHQMMSGVVNQGIGAVLEDALAPLVQGLLENAPNLLNPASVPAGLLARGRLTTDEARTTMARQGLGVPRQNRLLAASLSPLPVDALVSLWLRGRMEDESLDQALIDNSLHPDYLFLARSLLDVTIPAPDLAEMVVRNALAHDDARGRARKVGWAGDDFDLLTQIVGEPLGLEQLLAAYRRKIIDAARLQRAVRQSRVRDEWIDVIEELRFSPMSPADAIRATVQGHLAEAAAREIAEQGGLLPEHFTPLLESEGEPASVGEMLDLLNRGTVTEPQVTQAIRESRVKNKYIPALLKLRRRLPPERSVVSALAQGAVDRDVAIRKLQDLGYDAADAAMFATEASHTKTARHRDLTVDVIRSLHEDRALTDAQASDALGALGYNAEETSLLLALSTLNRIRKFQTGAVNRAHALYVSHKKNEAEIRALLDALEVPSVQIDDLLRLWDLERAANVHDLTPVEIARAIAKGIIDTKAGLDRLVRAGYVTGDALILIDLARPAPRRQANKGG